MKRARSDAERMRVLRIDKLQGRADSRAHERDMLRIELASVVRRPGGSWGDPKAVELAERLRPMVKEWEQLIEEIRALPIEQHAAKAGGG
jgi:hypothetical protein